jgi:hypothetical protein
MIFNNRIVILVCTACVTIVMLGTTIAADERCIAIGMPDLHGIQEFNAAYGDLTPDFAVRYENVRNAAAGYAAVTQELDAGRAVMLVVTFRDKGVPIQSESVVSAQGRGILHKVRNGAYDTYLRALAQKIQRDGRPIGLRFLHEANGDWEPWQAYYPGNDPADFVPAWKHVLQVMGSVRHLLRVDLDLNRRSAGTRGTSDFARFFPGPTFVDTGSVSTYNRCGTSPAYVQPKTFVEELRPAYDALRAITNKPIGIAETSTTSYCGVDKAAWIRDALNTADALHLAYVTFFFVSEPVGVASNTMPIHWELENEQQRAAFRHDVARLRAKYGPCAKPVAKVPQELPLNMHLPWTFQAKLESMRKEPYNDAENPITGNAFGDVGNRLAATYTQRVRIETGNISQGPYIKFHGIVSDNDNQWWNNVGGADVGYEVCHAHPSFADWGESCLFARAGKQNYFGPHPDRLNNAWEVGVGININLGGDLRK